MPYTARQRRYFHAMADQGKPGMSALAQEADVYASAGRSAEAGERQSMPEGAPAWMGMMGNMDRKGPRRMPRKAM